MKNFGNYLDTFNLIVDEILTKRDTRPKYFTLYFGLLTANEKRFLLYQFNFGTKSKPKEWEEVKQYLFKGFDKSHIADVDFRNYPFDGLS
jgi:hypothetical protein